jgi:hypothetical protein
MVKQKGKITKKIITVCIDKKIEKPIRKLYKKQHKNLSNEVNKFLLQELKSKDWLTYQITVKLLDELK